MGISGSPKVVQALIRGVEFADVAIGLYEAVDGARTNTTQVRFELGEGISIGFKSGL